MNGIDVKCSGIITPQRLSILQDAFLCSSLKHTHPAGSSFPRPCYRDPRTTSSTSTTFNDRHNTKAECSHFRALPTRYVTTFCNHALVTEETMASPLDFIPEIQKFLTAHPRDRVFGARTDASSILFTGFFICHPKHDDDKQILIIMQHATASALNDQEGTAIILLLQIEKKKAPMPFTKPALTTKMFALFSELSQKQKLAIRHSYTSIAKYHPCQKQNGAYVSYMSGSKLPRSN